MPNKNTDRDWEKVGQTDPYFGVLTVNNYKSSVLTEKSWKEFFLTGEKYVEEIIAVIHEKVDSTFRIEQALDFGCGVGRILIPLCKRALFVTGVDVSTGMLNEARKNCQAFAANNVELIHYNGSSLGVSGKFNFIHSFIVFQHIPKRRGTYLFVDLINHLEENGVGVIHFTYYRKATRVFRILYRLINKSSFLSGLWNIIRGQPASSPVLQMNMYDLNDLFRILQDQNCHNIHVRFTKHNEIFYGALIFFQKKSNIISGIG